MSANPQEPTDLVVRPTTPHGVTFGAEQVDLIKRTICKGATDEELSLFVNTASRLGLDPFTRQIHAVKRWNARAGREEMAIQVGIDGFRLVAQRSGEYEGQVGPQWIGHGADAQWSDVWLATTPPAAARVGVWRKGFREPCWAVARWESYKQEGKQGLTPLWKKMPDLMLAKCAEGLALRKAFPAELSGAYSPEEMAQAEPANDYQPPAKEAATPGPKASTANGSAAAATSGTSPVAATPVPNAAKTTAPAPTQTETTGGSAADLGREAAARQTAGEQRAEVMGGEDAVAAAEAEVDGRATNPQIANFRQRCNWLGWGSHDIDAFLDGHSGQTNPELLSKEDMASCIEELDREVEKATPRNVHTLAQRKQFFALARHKWPLAGGAKYDEKAMKEWLSKEFNLSSIKLVDTHRMSDLIAAIEASGPNEEARP